MSLYTPIKYALIIILAVGFALTIMHLLPELQKRHSDFNSVVVLVVQMIILLIGISGAYRDNRQLLLAFAIIMTVLVIVAVVQSQTVPVVGNAVLDIVSIILAVYQSEMIRSGDM